VAPLICVAALHIAADNERSKTRGGAMAKFRISSHGRLQDWIAVEHGFFEDEGLDYQFDVRALENAAQDITADDRQDIRVGAYELYLSGGGGKKNMSCACHWAVNQAAGEVAGRMWGHAYSVLPSGIYVAADSPLRRPEELAGVEIAVGYHSGSHFSTLQALEPFLDAGDVKLGFGGFPYDRVDALLAGDVGAAAVWGASTYLVEQYGCRRILDTTFMAAFMFGATIDPLDVERYFRALKRAQMELDLEPERYKHYYLREIPERYHAEIDVRCFGPGERVVFLPYTAEMYERSQRWMRQRGLFAERGATRPYESIVQV
jgi:NitT/TauT family transport system substrate-binding protein